MYGKIKEHLQQELAEIKAAGLYKSERVIESPQRAEIEVAGRKVLNFCANNYLGLSDNPRLIEAAKRAMDNRGYGMSSVRFICGCQDIHKQLEKAIADYFGTEDTILYAACFDANGGVFEPIFGQEDAIISDSLNHASIIDGVRLCKAVRYRYANADMAELEECLKQAQAQRFRIICTDGVFSMDGNAAPLDKICALAEKYDALVMVDECHSAGVLGKTGRGITELYDLRGQVDILTGTLGTAFGGSHLACAAAIAVLDVMEREKLVENAADTGEYLLGELRKADGPKEIRGRGLMIGIEIDGSGAEFRKKLLFGKHVFTGGAGASTVRLLPALCLTRELADRFLDAFDATLRGK